MGMFRRLANNRDGTTAVELAFVGPPFLLLLGAILLNTYIRRRAEASI